MAGDTGKLQSPPVLRKALKSGARISVPLVVDVCGTEFDLCYFKCVLASPGTEIQYDFWVKSAKVLH